MPAFIQSATFPFGVDQFLLRDAGSPVFGGEDDCDVLAEDFLPGEPEGFLRAGIPVLDAALGVEREDGEILDVIHDEALPGFLFAQGILDGLAVSNFRAELVVEFLRRPHGFVLAR